MKISNEVHEVFGNCAVLKNDMLELWVTLDFGPRVIHFSRPGKENVFYQDSDLQTLGEAFDVFGGEPLRLYGGHRLWVSPEVMPRCYYPDSKPVKYTETENGAEFIAPVENMNNIQKSITLTLADGEPSVMVTHSVKNCGHWDIELAPWAITMMAPGAVEVIPMPDSKTGFLPNRSVSLWDYSSMNDPRVYWGKKYITLRHNSDVTQAFKVGLAVEAGWSAIFNRGQLFLKFFEPDENAIYPDGGCNYETYVNGKFLESESLGGLDLLAPGESASHVEEWELYEETAVPSNDESEIDDVIAKYL